MEIRKAETTDLDGVVRVYDAVHDDQEVHGNCTNWQRGVYPTRSTAEKSLAEGTLYVLLTDGILTGTAIFNHEQLPEYRQVQWQYPGQGDQIMVIHTLCIDPGASGRGYAATMVSYAEELARRQGCTAMRLDTYEGNFPARALYTKLGYRLAGAAEFFFQGFIHEVLVLFEKAL